ncbi:Calcineurin-like phosphoesterase [Tenacibaculum sp. MAR_2009_124]|uniref:metallophosphoesterase n=1 Tax=Tenacibaculum sp. MAR_2009_124 TaxID=1250059 RepID=UPI00089C1127|nr:metallophosphoesterase [Tenacibaculum sp. MAR_2009_124]SED17442.1 Calcineurin-like phosphoesterase [Tenacibaculum sp. MAR_2009_124]
MTKYLTQTLLLLFVTFNLFAQQIEKKSSYTNLTDGPYVFIENEQLIEKNIINGKVISKKLAEGTYPLHFRNEKSTFQNIKKVVAFSDIHGQYDLAIKLLKNNKIVDKNLNWNLGKGHLVIVGDIFDRGPKVNEMLWLIYKLEQQAKKKKGKVHFLLGNHEYMVLFGDDRYVNKKYQKTCKLLNKEYKDLYGKQTVLGRWLRSKSTILKIDGNSFVHGGISKKFISNGYNHEKVNQTMRNSIDRSKKEMRATEFYATYFGKYGPIWYRGYFRDNLAESEIDSILNGTNSDHIVVGHCSNKEVVQLYNHKIFGVDSSIKRGKYGEVLFIKNGKKFSKGTLKGKKKKFKEEYLSK